MFNLLRSDFYRLVRWRTFWVYGAVMVGIVVAAACMLAYVAAPDYASTASSEAVDQIDYQEAMADYPFLEDRHLPSLSYAWAQMLCSGLLALMGSLLAAVFLAGEFSGGFIKNLLMSPRGRALYYGEKLLFIALLQGILLLLGVAAATVSFWAVGFSYGNGDGIGCLILWLGELWLMAIAYAFITACITWVVRSEWGGVVAAMLISSGMVGTVLLQLCAFSATAYPWMQQAAYLLPFTCDKMILQKGAEALFAQNAAIPIAGMAPWVWVMLVMFAYIAACAAVALGILRKRDI